MGNCLGGDNNGQQPDLDRGLMPAGGFMLREPMGQVPDPNDPWSDWYYDDYEQGGYRDRIESGRWDMSRESFRAKLAEKEKIRKDLARTERDGGSCADNMVRPPMAAAGPWLAGWLAG